MKVLNCKRLLMIGILVIGLCGCSQQHVITFSEPELTRLQGSVIEGRYNAAESLFNCEVPPLSVDCHVEDCYAPGGGAVAFRDNRGSLIKIEVMQLPLEIIIQAAQKQEVARNILHGFFEEVVMQTLTNASKETEILHTEFLCLGVEEAYFAVVLIPKMSTVINLDKGEPWDSIRGYIISIEGDQIVTISSQDALYIESQKRSSKGGLYDLDQVKLRLLKNLKETHQSFQNKFSLIKHV